MKHRHACLAICLSLATALVALALVPTLALAASMRIVNEKGTSFSSFSEALASVPDGGSTTLTLTKPDATAAALDLKVDRNITVAINAPSSTANNPQLKSVEVTAGTVSLVAEPGAKNNRYIEVTGVAKVSGGSLLATRCNFKNLVRAAAGAKLSLDSCTVIDPESSKQTRSDTNATVYLSSSASASIVNCQVDGDVGVGSGCTLSSVRDSKIVSRGAHSDNGILVASGGTVGEIRSSTIYGNKSALLFLSASSATIERSSLITGSGNKIDPGTNSSDWKGTKVEKSLEGSGRGVGFGNYYGSDREFDVTWFKGVIPQGYQLSRWTRTVTVPFINRDFSCRYLVRTDCSVTYDANGGTGDMSSSNKKNQWGDRTQKVAACTFTKTGRSFASWNTKPDGTGRRYMPGGRLWLNDLAQVTLYAQWSGKRCTISYDTQGGTPVAAQTVSEGEAFTRPEDPTNAVGSRAYDFAGWYTDAACTKEYDFATKATGDLKLYAKWLPSTCTLVFDSMGGSHVNGATAKYGEAATRPADPTRPHYRFKGWYEDEQCTRAYDFATKLTEESRTVYAKWGDYDECHVWDEGEVTEEPRCTTKGQRTYTCTADPKETHTRSEYSIPRLGHDMTGALEPYHWQGYSDSALFYEAPSCTKAGTGMYAQFCPRCGIMVRTEWRPIAPHGHNWSSWTLSDDGTSEYRVCSYDESHRETRAKTQEPCAHPRLEHVAAKRATCTESGNEEYWTCPDCMEWFLDAACTQVVEYPAQVFTEPRGHYERRWPEIRAVTAPTCTEPGSKTLVFGCAYCNTAVRTITVRNGDPTGHVWGPWAPVQGTNTEQRVCEHDATHVETREVPSVPCEHRNLMHVSDADATCTATGHGEYWVCLDCVEWFSDAAATQRITSADQAGITPSLGHDPGTAVRENEVSPTCEVPGGYDEVVRCTRCNEELSRSWVTVPATGHAWGDWETITAPTESFAGLERRTCAHDSSHTQEQVLPKLHKHTTEHIAAVAASCEHDGNMEYWRCTDPTCRACFSDEAGSVSVAEADMVLERLAHTPGEPTEETVVAPSCTEEGMSVKKTCCTVCNETISAQTITVAPTNHTPGAAEQANYVEATCEHAGTHDEIVSCTTCEQVLSWETVEDAAALGHQAGERTRENEEAATCEKTGSHDEVTRCVRCGKELERTWTLDDALGHDWGAWETITEATEYDEGLAKRVCGHDATHVEYRAIPRLGHEHHLLHIAAEPATCAAAGHEEYWYCDGCGEWFRDAEGTQTIERESDVVVAKLAHTPGSPEQTDVVPPTCEEDGHHDECVHCTSCGALLSRKTMVDEALGHDWNPWETVSKPSSHESGLLKRTCNRDKSHVEELVIPALHNHTLEYVGEEPATCWMEGTRAHWHCADENCGACFSDNQGIHAVSTSDLAIPRTAHDPDEKEVEEQWKSTCWDEGVSHEVVYCGVCGEELSRDVVTLPLAEHTPGEPTRENEVASTCSTHGTHDEVVYCTVCSEELSRRNVSDPCTEHTPGEKYVTNVVEATSVSAGSHDEVVCCAVCSAVLSWETIVDPPLNATYFVIEGEGGSWTRGGTEPLRMVFKRKDYDEETFGRFRGIRVDGQDVAQDAYDAEAGSVVVSLKPAYLETLSTDKHMLTALFEDGSADASFTIVDKPANTPAQGPADTPAPAQAQGPAKTAANNTSQKQSTALPYTGDSSPSAGVVTLLSMGLVAIGTRVRKRG